MSKRYLRQRPVYVLALIAVLALSFLGGANSTVTGAQEVSQAGPTVASTGSAAIPDTIFWCTVTDIWVIETAIGVNCSPGSGIWQFAYPNVSAADSRQANRYLMIANTARTLGKQIWLGYNDNSAANPAGCATASCRRITSMLIEP